MLPPAAAAAAAAAAAHTRACARTRGRRGHAFSSSPVASCERFLLLACHVAVRPGSAGEWNVEGVFEELDSPNEWYYDEDKKDLCACPPLPALPSLPFPPFSLARAQSGGALVVGHTKDSGGLDSGGLAASWHRCWLRSVLAHARPRRMLAPPQVLLSQRHGRAQRQRHVRGHESAAACDHLRRWQRTRRACASRD